jgi:hypothetical protein
MDNKPMHVRAQQLLPSRFVGRMIDSIGDFAFLLTSGVTVHFATISAVTHGTRRRRPRCGTRVR